MGINQQLLVFGYVRVSTDNQLENYSIDEQEERIKAYCTAKGWALLKIYTDGGFSGGNTNRPALQSMLDALKTTNVDAVVVYKLDRLSRSQKDTLTLIEDEFLSRNVDFVSINENFDTSTPLGRAMIGILSVFAQLEKDQITERFTMGRIARGKSGYYHGGSTPPTGYDYVEGKLEVNTYEAIQVREVFELFLAGKSINAIHRSMEAKYTTRWSPAKVRDVIKNSVYIGKVKFAGSEYDGVHKPLIEIESFEMANNLLNSSSGESKRHTVEKTPFRAEYLLSSLIFCRRCGARYSANHGYYKCYSRAKATKKFIKDPNCKNDHWMIPELDLLVLDSICHLFNSPPILDAILQNAPSAGMTATIQVNKQEYIKRIKDIDKQIEKLIDLYQVGALPMESISQRLQLLSNEKETLQKQSLDTTEDTASSKQGFIKNIQQFMIGLDAVPLETKRLLISGIIEAIWVDGGDVQIQWRI